MFSKLCRIGNQPEIRYTQSGDAVLSLSLAYNYGKKVDGKQPTQWLEGSLWGKQAEAVAPYFNKGAQISVHVDDLHIEEYEGKNGKGHKLTGRIVKFDFVSGGENRESAPEPKAVQPAQAGKSFDNFEDDLPF